MRRLVTPDRYANFTALQTVRLTGKTADRTCVENAAKSIVPKADAYPFAMSAMVDR